MSETFTYTFTDSQGHTDTVTVKVSTPIQTVSGSGITGQGYSVTSITGSIDGTNISGMVGSGAKVQTKNVNHTTSVTWDNTIFPNAHSGYDGNSSYGLDKYGLEFTVVTGNNKVVEYNLFDDNGTFELYDLKTNTEQALTLVSTNAPCFCAGTLISTPDGARNVEDLRAGELVLTADGVAVPVRWIGRRAVDLRFADPVRALPVRIKSGALGNGLPVRDLLVSPDHALFIDGILVQAGAMVNGTGIIREGGMPASFTYYHLETPEHALILAEGAPAETFIDNVSRMAFDNWAEYAALMKDAEPLIEMAYPRAKSARQVPASLRAKLAAFAAPHAEPAAA